MECIILAGGFGTRLAHIVQDMPKPMAPVNGRPFLSYVMDGLIDKGMEKFILAVGYKKECIMDFYGNSYREVPIRYSVEEAPLGTGGAIKKALTYCRESIVFVTNGDTFFDTDIAGILRLFKDSEYDIIIAAKRMRNFERYGTIESEGGRIYHFHEKRHVKEGLINGGVYLLKRNLIASMPEGIFSFESDFLEKKVKELKIGMFESAGYFIDIGIPKDYCKACEEAEKWKNI